VYGPVRTVVWQGSAGDRRPYADLVGKSDVIRAATARGLSQVSKHPYYACAVKRRWTTAGESPARELGSLHPEAIRAAAEETKPSEPLV
jgi:hypothetical protein